MPKSVRILLAAGGTGGHLFPGVAVAEYMERNLGASVLFLGTKGGIEKSIVPRLGFSLRLVPAEQFRGRTRWGKIRSLAVTCYGIVAAFRAIGDFRPDVIFSIGGYASGPTVVAGWLRGVPCVLLEPNAIAGLANRALSVFARRVCIGFEEAARFFSDKKVVYTGNPVRRDLQPRFHEGSDPSLFTLLVFGGSAGASRINRVTPSAVAKLNDALGSHPATNRPKIKVIHQTGERDYEAVKTDYGSRGISARVVPFTNSMGEAYAEADLVICRAGAITLAEVALLKKAAILVPYPYASDNHQQANAEMMVRAGAAIMVLDKCLTVERLAHVLNDVLLERNIIEEMGGAAGKLARPDATAAVVDACLAQFAEGPLAERGG